MSPRLSLTRRNKAQSAATCRYGVQPPEKQVVENARMEAINDEN